jgi:hypothetical protein
MNYLPKGLEWGVIKDNLLELGVPEDIIKRMEDAADLRTVVFPSREYEDIKLFDTLDKQGRWDGSPHEFVHVVMTRYQHQLWQRMGHTVESAIRGMP